LALPHELRLHSAVYETGRFTSVDPSRVVTPQDAVRLIEAMLDDLRQHPDEWENHTLERFLDALAASLASGRNWPEQSVTAAGSPRARSAA
jgi:hypothetical protein